METQIYFEVRTTGHFSDTRFETMKEAEDHVAEYLQGCPSNKGMDEENRKWWSDYYVKHAKIFKIVKVEAQIETNIT